MSKADKRIDTPLAIGNGGFSLKPLAAGMRVALTGGMTLLGMAPAQANDNLPVPADVLVSSGSASVAIDGTRMVVDQRSDRAILNWRNFNIGKDNSVRFQQPGSNSIALNRIAQQDPSRIMGELKANGQVYLVNANGFVFGKDAKVDVRGLTASTLNVTDEAFEQGVTKVFSNNGSAAFNGSGEIYQKNPDGSYKLDEHGNKIKIEIRVEQGAQIKSQDGQNILIIAPSITNEGDIQADDRQVTLAAATDKVYLQEAGNDGLLVEVKTGGDVSNLGNIAAQRGNVTLVGFAVNQQGKVSASTSLNVNGKIRLVAREGAASFQTADGYALQATSTQRNAEQGDGLGTSATVTLKGDSSTEILPDADDGATAIDEQAQPLSQLDIVARKVHITDNAQITVPGGKVNIVATENPSNPMQPAVKRNDSRILIDGQAKIDVSGLDTAVKAMESNVVPVELRLNQLKDAPLQRDGILYGETVYVDVRQGTPLTDIAPEVAGIQRSLAERLAKGGDISLKSEGDTLIQPGATLDFSGGAVRYLDGYINTTKLLSNGRIIDIGAANPALLYDDIVGRLTENQQKWGVSRDWSESGGLSLAQKEAGYTEGHDAGSLSITSPNVLLQGNLQGQTVSGRLQRTLEQAPQGGKLTIDMRLAAESDQAVNIVPKLTTASIPVDLQQSFPVTDAGDTLPLTLSGQQLGQSGIENFSIATPGTVRIAAGTRLQLADGGSLSLHGGEIDVAGSIRGASARVELTTDLNAKTRGRLSGDIILQPQADIDLQGGWVNDVLAPFNHIDDTPVAIDGGYFNARANGDVVLSKGSRVNVSGGAWAKADGRVADGIGGSIGLYAQGENTGSNLILNGLLSAFALRQGGTLDLESNGIAIVLRRKEEEDLESLHALQLDNDFFNSGGFSQFHLTANINGAVVEEGVSLQLRQVNRQLDAGALTRSHADSIAPFAGLATLPAAQRMPMSLTLESVHSINPNAASNLTVQRHASIRADALSSVALISDSSLTLEGSISVPAGDVALTVIAPQGLPTQDPLYQPTQALWLGDAAGIDVSGVAIVTSDAMGLKTGDVHDGGNVSLTANRGFVATSAGAVINVAGTSERLNVARLNSNGSAFETVEIGSDGGTLTITAAEGAFLDGNMQGRGGNAAGTAGGRFTLRLDPTLRDVPADEGIIPNFPRTPGVINLSQDKTEFFDATFAGIGDALPTNRQRQAFISAEQLAGGGFGNVTLQADGEVRLLGDLNLRVQQALQLDAPKLGWQRLNDTDTGLVNLNAAQVLIGSSLSRQPAAKPSQGEGQLSVNADFIELYGGSYTAGFQSVDLAAAGDIRLRGIRTLFTQRDYSGGFSTYNQLNLSADQIYTGTLSQFGLSVQGASDGLISINGGNSHPVLSAYSQLTLTAPNIEQNGVIKAPFGEILLEAGHNLSFGTDSLTSVSGEGQTIPFGVTQGGLEWLYPIGTQNLIVKAPGKSIELKADAILREEGAVIDVSGGGDLQAYEFVPGIGGSADVLAGDNAYAVLPGLTGYAPYDPLETPASGLSIGDSVYLGEGSGLAAGFYTLLPAHYALLPGAFLITPQGAGGQALQGNRAQTLEGAPVVAGYRTVSGTAIRDALWSAFAVEPGAIALTRSQLDLTSANRFFADQAAANDQVLPRLPQDAGSLVFNAKTQLSLPQVRTEAAQGGLAGLVDITADTITVVNQPTGSSGVEISVADLDGFSAGSLFLGGVRQVDQETGETRLDVRARHITIAQNTVLQGPEIVLAATTGIELQTGARVSAEGAAVASTANPVLNVTGDGALLQVSNGRQAQIVRTGSQGRQGDLAIRDGAAVAAATGSVLLDSTGNLQMQGALEVGKSLNIGAEAINIGEVNTGLAGFSLNNAQLSLLNIAELQLTSRSDVNIYGNLQQADGAALPFQHLTIDAQGLVGVDNAGATALLAAKTLTLRNSGAAKAGNGTGSGSGRLQVTADNLELDGGNIALSGFADMDFNVRQAMLGRGNSGLLAEADLALAVGYIGGESGSVTRLDAGRYNISLSQAGATELPAESAIAGQLQLVGNQVLIDAPLLFRGGQVNVAADGDIRLSGNAVIDVAGSVAKAGLSAPQAVAAGEISLVSLTGDIVAESGSRLLLQGDKPGVAAGTLAVAAPAGQVGLNGVIAAHGGEGARGGSVQIDTVGLADGFAPLAGMLAGAGFDYRVDLRTRTGDIAVESQQALVADHIALTADTGRVALAGKLNARGNDGGSIAVNAGQGIDIASGAVLDAGAEADDGNGGKILLNAADGGIAIHGGARLDVSAGAGDQGSIRLRARRLSNDVAIEAVDRSGLIGTPQVIVEAVARYDANTLDAGLIARIGQDTALYMNDPQTLSRFAGKFGAGFELAPGVEVRSGGDLTLASAWNLADWRYGATATPGYLTLRAAGNLSLRNDLSDAFKNGVLQTETGLIQNVTDLLQSGRSWSYDLVGGADVNSAAVDALLKSKQPENGDVLIGNNVKVRTGTGSIDVFAARDIVYGNDRSVVYTAGRPDDTDRFGLPMARVLSNFYVEYPLDGGDIGFTAGRHIKGALSNQIVSDWLLRTGNWSDGSTHNGERPTAWGIAIGTRAGSNIVPDYRQNLGALAGGNITVTAGGNISDLSVVIPTTGKQIGQRQDPDDPNNQNYLTNAVQVNGGGNLQLDAGGDLQGGMFYVDGGTAQLHVDGSVGAGAFRSSAVAAMNPIVALGDARFDISAGRNLALQAIVDPMILPQPGNKKPDLASIFFRYGDNSSLTLTALTGDIKIGNDVAAVIDFVNNRRATPISFAGAARDSLTVAVPSLMAYALNGDLVFKDSMILYPGTRSRFELFAAQNILGGGSGNQINITLSDTDQTLLPSAAHPAAHFTDAGLRLVLTGIGSEIDKIHAATPNHLGDPRPALISTAYGDILGLDPFQFIIPKPTQVLAGRDIRNVSLQFQHNDAGATSSISAGRDFKFDIVRSPSTGALVNVVQSVEVSGPGRLTIMAGRNVDLGSSAGIATVGNQVNTGLAEDGAAIDVLAGLGQTRLAVDDFVARYVSDQSVAQNYAQMVTDYMRKASADDSLSETAALAAFKRLPVPEQSHVNAAYLARVVTIFNRRIAEQGDIFAKAKAAFDAASDQTVRFEYKQKMDLAQFEVLAAIETLFPGSTVLANRDGYRIDAADGIVFDAGQDAGRILAAAFAAERTPLATGDISMFFSKIHSTDGGDINLLTPNGGINAGLAVNSSGAKDASQLGVVAIKQGSVHAIVRDDFQVNTTRVMTLGGGDIAIGSTEGNIDAGRGAKTALAAPAPIVRFDNRGNMIVELPPAVAGSGIRANQAIDGSQGNVLLFALLGIIDASEAGLGGKDVTVGATAIVGSDNIDVGGVSVGVPTVAVGSIAAGLGSISNVAASVTQSIESSTDVAKTTNEQMTNAALGMISIDILGFGDDEDKDKD